MIILHIISPDEEIKKGEYYYSYITGKVGKAISNGGEPLTDKKIIASTNELLNLPSPSNSFIEKYIEEYNKGQAIEDVMIKMNTIGCADSFLTLYPNGIKINPKYNTITIRRIKDSWNREDIKELLFEYTKYCNNIFDSKSAVSVGDFTKWINENL